MFKSFDIVFVVFYFLSQSLNVSLEGLLLGVASSFDDHAFFSGSGVVVVQSFDLVQVFVLDLAVLHFYDVQVFFVLLRLLPESLGEAFRLLVIQVI